ncbi:8013_t:CDS:2, partial [Scutellospora calospora]
INDRLEYPLEIDLQRYLLPGRSKLYNYLLNSIIVHSGDLYGGNYHVFLKPEKNSKWITPATNTEVLEDNYGVDAISSTNAYTNAYILIYI